MQAIEAWIPGVDLMMRLGADEYYVQLAGFYEGGQARGLAVYKKDGVCLARRDAVEVCEEAWTMGGKVSWYVSPHEVAEG